MLRRCTKHLNYISFSGIRSTSVPQPETYNSLNNERINQVCNLLKLNRIIMLNWLRYKKFTGIPAELSPQQMDELVLWFVVQWSIKQGINQVDVTVNSYFQYVPCLISQGYEELEAIKQWMNHVQSKSSFISSTV